MATPSWGRTLSLQSSQARFKFMCMRRFSWPEHVWPCWQTLLCLCLSTRQRLPCLLCTGKAAGLRPQFGQADRKPGEGRRGGSLRRSGPVELQQDHQEQGGHPTGRGDPSAGAPAQVPTQEHAYSCGGHAAGVCLSGEEGHTPPITLKYIIKLIL